MLRPGKLERYLVGDTIMVRTGTIGDGSCFFHSVHYALSEKYRAMNDDQKREYIQRVRNHIADSLTVPIVKNLGKGTVWELLLDGYSNLCDEDLLEVYKNLIRHEWVNEFCWELLQDVYQTNIIVIKDHKRYRLFQNEFKYPNNIFLLWVDESHYEVLGYHMNDVLIAYSMMNEHPFIQQLRV